MIEKHLKCCGNCFYREIDENDIEHCDFGTDLPSCKICKKWKFDGYSITERLNDL